MEEFSENYPKGQNPKKYDVKAMNKHYLEETGRKFNLNKNKDSIDDEDCRVGCTTNGCQAKPTPTSSETDTKWADKPKPLRPNVQLCTDWRGLQKTGDMSTTCLNNPKCDSDAALKSAEAFKAPRDTSLKKGCGSVATLDDPDLTAEKCWALQRSIDPKVYHHRDITHAPCIMSMVSTTAFYRTPVVSHNTSMLLHTSSCCHGRVYLYCLLCMVNTCFGSMSESIPG